MCVGCVGTGDWVRTSDLVIQNEVTRRLTAAGAENNEAGCLRALTTELPRYGLSKNLDKYEAALPSDDRYGDA